MSIGAVKDGAIFTAAVRRVASRSGFGRRLGFLGLLRLDKLTFFGPWASSARFRRRVDHHRISP